VVIFENGETAAAMLSGFTITNGGDVEHGGGIRLSGGSNPTLNNLIVQNNEANNGGGISLISSSPTLSNVTISGNTASAGDGGGLRCISSSSTDPSSDPSLMNVTITNNTSNGSGGGIYAENSPFTLDGVTVSNNTATGDDPQIQEAGGISVRNENGSSNNIHIRIVNSIISSNTASGGSSTGGLFFFQIDSVTIASTEINGNSGMYTGGLYTNQVNYFNMSSSLVAENTGLYYGGVSFLATANENPAQITNCTITNNSYTQLGSEGNAAGLMVERVAFASILNSIISSEQSPAVTVGK
jgi:predicted outer membrane repeat protein